MRGKPFEPDELVIARVNGLCGEVLLGQAKLFYLREVLPALGLQRYRVLKHVRQIELQGGIPYREMGVRKFLGTWIVRMVVFAGYYRANIETNIRVVDVRWDAQALLAQPGSFELIQVCGLLPYTMPQMMELANQCGNPRAEMGLWAHPDSGVPLVEMARFARFLRSLDESPISQVIGARAFSIAGGKDG